MEIAADGAARSTRSHADLCNRLRRADRKGCVALGHWPSGQWLTRQ